MLINPSSHKAQELQVCHFAAIQATTYISLKDRIAILRQVCLKSMPSPFPASFKEKKQKAFVTKHADSQVGISFFLLPEFNKSLDLPVKLNSVQ